MPHCIPYCTLLWRVKQQNIFSWLPSQYTCTWCACAHTIYICTHTTKYVHLQYTHTNVHERAHTHTYIPAHTRTHTHTHTRTHAYAHIHTHTHTQGHVRHNWRTRWFVLTKCSLSYFRKREVRDEQPGGPGSSIFASL